MPPGSVASMTATTPVSEITVASVALTPAAPSTSTIPPSRTPKPAIEIGISAIRRMSDAATPISESGRCRPTERATAQKLRIANTWTTSPSPVAPASSRRLAIETRSASRASRPKRRTPSGSQETRRPRERRPIRSRSVTAAVTAPVAAASPAISDPGTGPGLVASMIQETASRHRKEVVRSRTTEVKARGRRPVGRPITRARAASPPMDVGRKLLKKSPMAYARQLSGQRAAMPAATTSRCQRKAPNTCAVAKSRAAAANHAQLPFSTRCQAFSQSTWVATRASSPAVTTRRTLSERASRPSRFTRGTLPGRPEGPDEPRPELGRAAVRGVANVRVAQHGLREPTDGNGAASFRELAQEGQAGLDLGAGWPAVRRLRPRMRRHDVPEEDVVFEAELGEDAVDDGCSGLGGPFPGQLALGGEGQARDARAAIAGCLADQKDRRVCSALEVGGEPASTEGRIGVLVEGAADLGGCEPLYQRSQRTTSSSGFQPRRAEPLRLSGAGLPTVTTA